MSAAPPPPPPPEPTGHRPYGSGPVQPPPAQPTPAQPPPSSPSHPQWSQPSQAAAAGHHGPAGAPPHTSPHGSTGPGTHSPPGPGHSGAPAHTSPDASRGPVSTFLRALFDLKFEHFVTLKFSAIIYVLLIAYFVLIWLGSVLVGLIAVSQDSSGLVILLPALLLGWIPALISILMVRVCLEFLSAGIRTAINTGKLVEQR
ncbi:DUF4282 domain-containing protein [Brevibacterium jeotgali]|uniref:DUF4282 domain-containing protein n=1 Tax=Brevibacterium jeotgali TaxID=1262550 RepID=A0A2H1L356_9MICO|nr:DUF4282 domain-containing protein [Brevibacterium jeotgali]TWC02448.1 uncharacterized protein DUF4282 [Brevibacterium jeotgali]SMY11240.1 protein of unknown function (DUF4282) [Brevibacterium jeotgali]